MVWASCPFCRSLRRSHEVSHVKVEDSFGYLGNFLLGCWHQRHCSPKARPSNPMPLRTRPSEDTDIHHMDTVPQHPKWHHLSGSHPVDQRQPIALISLPNWVLLKVDCFPTGPCLTVTSPKATPGINIGKEGWLDNLPKVDVDGVSSLCILTNLLLFSQL